MPWKGCAFVCTQTMYYNILKSKGNKTLYTKCDVVATTITQYFAKKHGIHVGIIQLVLS